MSFDFCDIPSMKVTRCSPCLKWMGCNCSPCSQINGRTAANLFLRENREDTENFHDFRCRRRRIRNGEQESTDNT